MNIEFYEDNPQTPPPIKERIGKGMFTDRESEMALLMDWADSVSREAQKSIALVSPRRYGKTAIMERFYNRIFWERNDLVPFYFELKPDKLYIRNFINQYYLSFLRQFLVYRTKNIELASIETIAPDKLYKLAEEAKEERVMRSIDAIPGLSQLGLANFFHAAIELPRNFAAREEENIIVMFDEFQRLNQVLYFDEELQKQCPPYTGAFSSVVEAAVAPMFIAGSQMTILAREALSGGMVGRVRQIKLKRMNKDGCAKLATKLAYDKGFELPLDLAHTIADLTWRHPYYIWCLFNTNRLDDGLHTEEDVKARIKFEIEDNLSLIHI